MLNSKNKLSFLAFSGFIFMAVASAPSSKSLTVESGQMPPDFKGYNKILLITRYSKDWTKYAEKYFNENYSGDFIVVESKDVNTSYADTEKYRFQLTRNQFSNKDISSGTRTYSQDLCILDRKTGESYCTKSSTSFYGKLLKAYSQALETERTK